jgi:hypothetical protein
MKHFVRTHKTLPPCYEGRESFKCEIESCGYIFLRKYRLDEHIKAVHGDKNKTNASRKVRNNKTFASKPGSIHCPECNRPMSSDHKLKRHINTMHGEKKFHCLQCGEGFCTMHCVDMPLQFMI